MFKVKDRQNSCVEPFEFLPAKSGEVYALGEALPCPYTIPPSAWH